MENKLPVHSIFESISGEVGVHIKQGAWTTFIRLQGCNLVCTYCDTQVTQRKANQHDNWMDIDAIVEAVKTKNVVITGGEPLIHKNLFTLADKLFAAKKRIQIETNGTIPIPVAPYVGFVIDYKAPSSGVLYISAQEFLQMIHYTSAGFAPVIKFVIGSEADLIHAEHIMSHLLEQKFECSFAFSPVNALANKASLIASFIEKQSPEVRNLCILNLQIHKIVKLA